MYFCTARAFDDWRDTARELLAAEIQPHQIAWNRNDRGLSLFGETPIPPATATRNVPKAFLDLAKDVAHHRDTNRYEILYRTLWRLTHGEKHLLEVVVDEDVNRLDQMQKAVRRDIHKMKAFVRFRLVGKENGTGNEPPRYVAWHEPDHRVVTLAAPFFARRFKGMTWSILTPDESAHWDQHQLIIGPGATKQDAPESDELEDLWKMYYQSIFNPARVKLKAMKAEMPVRYWKNMPETEKISDLIAEAPGRVDTMLAHYEGFTETAASYFDPAIVKSANAINELQRAAQVCQACSLHQHAHQIVFGEGPRNAKLVLIGEQPVNDEVQKGVLLAAPSLELLHHALAQAGIEPNTTYLTNIVKHSKFVDRGERRIHPKPNSREIYACRPWLEAELASIQPRAIVCLGATPAQAILGRDFQFAKQRGQVLATPWCEATLASWHPANILRLPKSDRKAVMVDQLIADLQRVIKLI